MNILLCILPPAATDFPLLGPAMLAGALSQAGHTCTIHDANIALHEETPQERHCWKSHGWPIWQTPKKYAPWLERVAEGICTAISECPSIGGLALSFTSSGRSFASTTIERVCAYRPELPIIVGGPGFFHGSDVETFARRHHVSICRGEGEAAILDWARHIAEKSLPDPRTYRHPIGDLANLPFPDFSPYARRGYTRPGVLPLETSRGCTNHCRYCDDTQMWKGYRMKPTQRVARELEACLGGMKHVSFCDSLLNPTPRRMEQLASQVKPFGITWDGMMQCKGIDERLAQAMAESGCKDVFLGVESFEERFLKQLGKRSTPQDAHSAIRALHGAGINVSIGLIIAAAPLQSREQFQDDLDTIESLAEHLHSVSVNPLCIPDGTPLWNQCGELGITLPNHMPWFHWHEGGGARDVAQRMQWCIQACEVCKRNGIPLGQAPEEAINLLRENIEEAKRCL